MPRVVTGRIKANYLPTTSRMSIGSNRISAAHQPSIGVNDHTMYRSNHNGLCRMKVLQRFVRKTIFAFIAMIMSFLLSGCINWAHVVENNPLRVIETNRIGSNKIECRA
jgi:hypothetical protein